MPYTSPSRHSPASSTTNSPTSSRNNLNNNDGIATYNNNNSNHNHVSRSPSSKDFMYKHRRTPSYTKDDSSKSVKQSDDRSACDEPRSNGTVSSVSNKEHDSEGQKRGKQKPNFRLENLAELEEALRLTLNSKQDFSPGGDENTRRNQIADLARQALSEQVRKFSSHSRSSSEVTLNSKAFRTPSASESAAASDSDDEDDLEMRPPLVRKKSGELVKPALRLPAHKRPSSLPGTPTFGKAVHFHEEIEQVRHFLQVDRPMAVSATTSPVEAYGSESEFPFGDDEGSNKSSFRAPSWDIRLSNFPQDSYERQTIPVRLERMFLSPDQKNLVGVVAVANLCYHKLVMARFTFDYWKTTSEVAAEYMHDVWTHKKSDNYDRFTFNIRLSEQANLEKKTLLLCVRYNVNGQDYWDNNQSMNYQVGFVRNVDLPKQRPGASTRRASTEQIPRSRGSGVTQRPRSMPPSFDDEFVEYISYDFRFRQPKANLRDLSPQQPLQQPKLRFKNTDQSSSDGSKQSDGQGVASKGLSTRYDFGASLSAALSNAQTALGDRSRIEPRSSNSKVNFGYFGQASDSNSSAAAAHGAAKSAAFAAEKPDLKSAEYNELIQKYCFFGSGKNEKHHPAVTVVSSAMTGKTDASPSGTADKAEKASLKNITAVPDSASKVGERAEPQSISPQVDGADDTKESPKQHNVFSHPKMSSVHSGSSSGSSRAQSPVSFGYLYPQNMHGGGLFGETQAPQAILS